MEVSVKQKTKILIIDDDWDFLNLFKTKLEIYGYEAYTSSRPLDFERRLEKINPDIVFMDVLMPERSGFNILEDFEARGKTINVPVIFLSGFDSDVEKMIAKGMGVREYLIKPIADTDLTDIISKNLIRKAEQIKK